MGARALPAAVLAPQGAQHDAGGGVEIDAAALRRELERVRLESGTLAAAIGLVTSSPDLEHVLGGVVDLLSRATGCHACFVYLRSGDRLLLRAASHIYAHLVGKVEFGVEEGLAGWVARRNTPAFIREHAQADPRTNYVPEMEEERFQSMAAVPVRSRQGPAIGVIVLHTVAPREFDDATTGVLEHTAPLLAGAIENAQLYEAARRRVQALTELTSVSRRIASLSAREEVLRAAGDGVRTLLGCEAARIYELDASSGRLELVWTSAPEQTAQGDRAAALRERAVPVTGGGEQLGMLVAADRDRFADDAEELLGLIASQLGVALERSALIERLTEENIVRDLFTALEHGRAGVATARAQDARIGLGRSHVIVELRAAATAADDDMWPETLERVETALRRLAPGTVCDASPERLRALLPLGSAAASELAALDRGLAALAAESGSAIGRSEVSRDAARSSSALAEAADAAAVAHALAPDGGARAYGTLGAYRYLVNVDGRDHRDDPYLLAVRTLAGYDERRGTSLLATLEAYLGARHAATHAAKSLAIHPNTLRQRLERIEAVTALRLADADLLALELAVKLVRLRPRAPR